jgi:hypothetical protein
MLTPQQINEIRKKSGLPPINKPEPITSQPKQSVGRFDHLLQQEEKSTLRKVGDFFTSSTQKFGNTLGTAASVLDQTKGNVQDTQKGIQEQAQNQIDLFMQNAKKETDPNKKKDWINAAKIAGDNVGVDIFTNPEYQKTAKQILGEAGGTALEALSLGTFGSTAKVGSLASKAPTILKPLLSPPKNILKGAKEGAIIGSIYGSASGATQSMQENESNIDVLKSGITEGAIGGLGGGVIGGGISGAVALTKGTGKVLVKAGDKLSTPVKAIGQTGSELAERVPRAIERVKESANEAVLRSARIKESTPEVANAIKSKLDDRIINTIAEVDEPTRKAFKQVVEIAEETPKSIGLKKQPSIVSGELASKQFEVINKQKQKIGKDLGEKVKELSKTEKVNMADGFRELDDTLASQGIQLQYTKKGVKLDFSGTKYTPAERTKIQELYNLASEGGANLSPSSIHGKDQLFSKLQREATMEGVGKIMVDTPDGTKSLFSVFRDVFSKNLEDVSPEIRELNKKYRNLALVVEDIEDSILRTPNFNITKTADPAEFAKVNLRRIFGEAQSSPVFEAIADQMDALARQLGYADASPKQVAEFAQELRKLYPESIPKAGFTGGISTGVKGALGSAIEATMKAGAPNLKDQRKALIELLESSLKPVIKDVKGIKLKKAS